MQTPIDRNNWRGQSYDASTEGMRAAASDYITRCYETGLEAIGITDHNFASLDFIPHLRAAATKLSRLYGYEIAIFPGFEINADVGKGMHCLALFDPYIDLSEIDHILTSCGVPFPRFGEHGQATRSVERLPKILDVVQRRDANGRPRGIVICPHSQAEAGIFDNEAISEWLQQHEFVNPDLLCVEVPKPVQQMSSGWQRLFQSGPDCHPGWRRRRPIACIMSSDAKALRPEDGAENFIGFRHSWIKMSEPSIEALRQAFLDHDSRIRLSEHRPEDQYEHPRIVSFRIKDAAFLADQALEFSPTLNTIIGGRGTGKSTILEYLRIGIAQEHSIAGEDGVDDTLANFKRSLRKDSVIEIDIEKSSDRWTLRSTSGNPPTIVSGEHFPQIERFFPVRVFSQRQILRIAESSLARRRLIEDLARTRLDALARQEEDLQRNIGRLSQRIAEIPALERRVSELQSEIVDFELRIRHLEHVMEPLATWQRFRDEKELFDRVHEDARGVVDAFEDALEAAKPPETEMADRISKGPYADLAISLASSSREAVQRLVAAVRHALDQFDREITAVFDTPDYHSWNDAREAEQAHYDSIKNDLEKQGIDPDQYLQYHADLRSRRDQLAQTQKDIAELQELQIKRDGLCPEDGPPVPGLMSELMQLWKEQHAVRQEAALGLTEALPRTAEGSPFLEISVQRFGDEAAFLARMLQHLKDKRRIGEEDWDLLMKSVFAEASRREVPPTELLVDEVTRIREESTSVSDIFTVKRYVPILLEWFKPDALAELRLWRTPDRVTVELFRQDGSRVGQLDGPELSIGQRCTAVLAMILARDDVPVLIDQPEEDLDNEFIYRELVPLLRRIKQRRQIILVSHNANIPVNGDAELIAALEVREGRGSQKIVADELATGALDRRPVQVAVEEIMEGSEEAFRRRHEKYGF